VIEPHLPALPVLLPLVAAVVLLWLGDAAPRIVRLVSLAFVLLGLGAALALVDRASSGELLLYRLGAWPAPFGIVLVVDRLAALMVLLVQLVALPVLVHASGGWDLRGRYFHALFQFLLMGLCGAFVTGDLFNLFVFFEVLLTASYVLLVHGHGRERFRWGVPYVVLNLVASALFLIGVAVLYSATGTLNLADLARRVAEVGEPDAALLRSGALLLFVVFGFKAALAPLHLWLPAAYAAASPPVAALFVLMTKVGVVAILRVHGAVFGDAAGAAANVVPGWLMPLALVTAALGVFGALAAHTLAHLIAWLNIASVATVLIAVSLWSAAGWSAALYYMVHSTLVVAALFLLAELVAAQRGAARGRLEPASPVAQPALLGSLLLLAAASIVGLPPLPGFLGKLMILQAADSALVWTVVLASGFVTMIGLARAGSILFWSVREESERGRAGHSAQLVATAGLLALGVAMALAAAPIKDYTDAAALQLRDGDAYLRAVLGRAAPSVRPYPPAP